MSTRTLASVLLAASALAAAAGPVSLLPDDAAATYVARRKDVFSALPANGDVPAGFRMTTPQPASPIWNIESSAPLAGDVHQGDLLVVTVATRGVQSGSSAAEVRIKLQGGDYKGVVDGVYQIGKDWAWQRFVGTAPKDYPAGSLRLHIYPAFHRQTAEFRGLRVENYGAATKDALPPLPSAPAFGGAALSAPDIPPPAPMTKLPPLSAADKAKPRYVMLKIDDIGAGDTTLGIHPRFIRIADYLAWRKIKCGFGVIVKSIENDNPAYIRWIQLHAIENGGLIEFWNHGWDHAMNFEFEGKKCTAEFSGPSLEHQRENLARSQDVFKAKTGLTMHSIGTAGNAADASTPTVLSERPEIKVWMYGNANSPGGKTVLRRTFNLEYAVGKVDYEKFVQGYKDRRTLDYVVLQGHAAMWDDANWDEFVKIIDLLVEDGWSFTTPYEYATKILKK